MMNEIGSEFWDVPITNRQNNLFPESTQWFLSGRGALQSIIKDMGASGTVSLPSWCCDSIIKPFVDAHYTVRFYPVAVENGELVQEVNMDSDVLFLMDFFGFTSPTPDLSVFHGTVIRDVTHSIFSSTYSDADYFFGSLRKWCGVWTGGYAWTRDGHKLETGDTFPDYITLRYNAMDMKMNYIEKGLGDKGYLKVFDMAEESLKAVGISPAAERDIALVHYLDVERIRKQRRKNADVLRAAFSDWLIFPTQSDTDIPMFVPILVPNGKRDELRRYLIKNEIFCPIHWPVSDYHKLNEKTAYIYQNELSLVCDQRYTEKDMYRMIDTINTFIEG